MQAMRRCFLSRWARTALLVVLAAGVAQARAQGGEKETVERQVKAAYLYKFGSFVEWPERAFAAADSPLRIAVVGAPQLADELGVLTDGRTLGGRAVSIQKLRWGDSVSGYNVVFIGGGNGDRLADVLAATRGKPILTVTESTDGITLGSVINFVIVDGKLRFEVNPRTASQGNLNVSARLLSAAWKVVAP